MRRDERGQMSVELAVLLPVMLVLAAVAINVLIYLGDCAKFDRVAAEAVRVCGTSAGYGQYGVSACEANVREYIEDAFADSDRLEFSVTSADIGSLTGHEYSRGNGLVFSLIPMNRRYSCTMKFTPPLFSVGVFGTSFASVSHECEFVVDPYQPQGWS